MATPYTAFAIEAEQASPNDNKEELAQTLKPSSALKNPYSALVNMALSGKDGSGANNYADVAAQYCRTARDQNDPNAQFAMGWLYTNGRGVDKDENTAAMFFSLAAEQGHHSAKTWLSNSKGDASQATLPACMLPDPPTQFGSVQLEDSYITNRRDGKPVQFYSKGPIYKLVSKLAPKYEIDVDLAMAFIAVESGFNPKATSPKNAQGLMQLIPETAARFNVKDAYNPEENIKGGLAYLRWLMAHFKGDVQLVAAAYNAGERAVVKYQGVPPYAETRAYVKKISALYRSSHHPYRDDLGVTPAIIKVSTTSPWPRTSRTNP